MKKKKFDWLMLGLSLGLSAAAAALIWYLSVKTDLFPAGIAGCFVRSVLFLTLPLLGGLSGVCLAERIRQKQFSVMKRPGRGRSFLIALASGVLLGGFGQLIYMVTVEEYEKEAESEAEPGDSDLVLLLDCSDSMQGKKASCGEAACQLTDKLGEGNFMQVVSFAGRVLGQTELLPMDPDGKQSCIEFIHNIDLVGMTNFNAAFRTALDTLDGSATGNGRQAVILITDGQASLDEGIKEECLEANIIVYSIRLAEDGGMDSQSEALVSFVEETGGFNTEIQVDAEGDISVEKLLEALESAAIEKQEPVYGKRLALGERLLVGGDEAPEVRHYAIRFLVFLAYGILITWAYYGKAAGKNIAGCVGAAVLMAAAAGLLQEGAVLVFAYCIFFWTAFTSYDFVEEDAHV